MSTTIVRVKRKRSRAFVPELVVEFVSESGEDGAAAAARRRRIRAQKAVTTARADALARALDAVLEGGSAGTPYGRASTRTGVCASSSSPSSPSSHAREGKGGDSDDEGKAAMRPKRRKFEVFSIGEEATGTVSKASTTVASSSTTMTTTNEGDILDAGVLAKLEGRADVSGIPASQFRIVDVLYDTDGNAHSGAENIQEALAREEVLMCNYLPMVREYLGNGMRTEDVVDSEVPMSFNGEDEDDDGWVYDYYYASTTVATTSHKRDAGEWNDDGYLPTIRIKDLHDSILEEEQEDDDAYEDSDSNAEDYVGADYPDYEESDSDESGGRWCPDVDGFSDDDSDYEYDDYY